MCIGFCPVFLPSAASGTLTITGTGSSASEGDRESNGRGLQTQETETQEGNMTAMVLESSIMINSNICRLFRLTTIHHHNCMSSNHNQHRKNRMSSIAANNAVDVSSSDGNDVYASSSPSSSPNDRKRSRPYSSCQSLLHTNSNNNSDNNINNNKRLRRNDTPSPSRRLSLNSSRRVTFNDVRSSRSSLHSLSDDDKNDLWYSLEDCAAMNEDMKREIRAFRSNNIDRIRHMICVSSQCSYSKPNKAFLDMVRLDLPDECRGLERTLLPPRQNRENKQEHVRKVVEAQQMMKDWFRMGQKEQQDQKQTTSFETKVKEREAHMNEVPKNAEEGDKIFCRKNNNIINTNTGKKQRKSSSSSSSRRLVMGSSSSSSSKLDLVIASRARKSSQSSRLFAQLLGREVATSVKTEVDHIV